MERTKLILPNINIKNIDNTLECFLKQVHSSDEYKKVQDDYNKIQNYEHIVTTFDPLIFYIIGIIILMCLLRFRNNTVVLPKIIAFSIIYCIFLSIKVFIMHNKYKLVEQFNKNVCEKLSPYKIKSVFKPSNINNFQYSEVVKILHKLNTWVENQDETDSYVINVPLDSCVGFNHTEDIIIYLNHDCQIIDKITIPSYLYYAHSFYEITKLMLETPGVIDLSMLTDNFIKYIYNLRFDDATNNFEYIIDDKSFVIHINKDEIIESVKNHIDRHIDLCKEYGYVLYTEKLDEKCDEINFLNQTEFNEYLNNFYEDIKHLANKIHLRDILDKWPKNNDNSLKNNSIELCKCNVGILKVEYNSLYYECIEAFSSGNDIYIINKSKSICVSDKEINYWI